MGQKANLLTIRKNFLNLDITSENNHSFLNFNVFLKNFLFAVSNKKIWIFKYTFNLSCNSLSLVTNVFYKTQKISYYKTRLFIKRGVVDDKNDKFLKTLFNLYFSKLRITRFNFSIRNLNSFINLKFITFLYAKTSRFIKVIFARQFSLYLDFLKVTSLFYFGFVSSNCVLQLISLIFKNVPKRAHNRFLAFIKTYFNILLFKVPYNQFFSDFKPLGLKLLINGRLQGKPRSGNAIVMEGSIPNQSLDKKICLSFTHVYTKLGSFGLKLYTNS